MVSRREFLKLSGSAMLASALPPRWNAPGAKEASPVPTIWRGSSHHRYVALTYDDCYLLRRMQDLEDLLEEFPEFKITLFPVGIALLNLQRQDDGIWKRFYEKGHEIGYHSWDHGGIHVISAEHALADFDRWMEALIKVLGFQPTVHFSRPPFGVLSPSFDAIARARGQVVTMWSTGWGGEVDVGLRAAQNSRNADIVLLHIRTQDYNTSRVAFPWLRENNWGAVTISRLYDDLLRERNQSDGCGTSIGGSLTRTCLE